MGGLSTTFPVNFNDVDYCLKAYKEGLRIVYDPDLIMYHFESSSRDPEVKEWELNRLHDRWLAMTMRDPFGNPGLTHGLPRISSYVSWVKRRPGPLWKRQRRRFEPTR